MTIYWKAVEQYGTVLCGIQFCAVCNVGIFGLGTVKSERVKHGILCEEMLY